MRNTVFDPDKSDHQNHTQVAQINLMLLSVHTGNNLQVTWDLKKVCIIIIAFNNRYYFSRCPYESSFCQQARESQSIHKGRSLNFLDDNTSITQHFLAHIFLEHIHYLYICSLIIPTGILSVGVLSYCRKHSQYLCKNQKLHTGRQKPHMCTLLEDSS